MCYRIKIIKNSDGTEEFQPQFNSGFWIFKRWIPIGISGNALVSLKITSVCSTRNEALQSIEKHYKKSKESKDSIPPKFPEINYEYISNIEEL